MTLEQRKREFAQDLRSFVCAHGWSETASILRAEVFVYVGFESVFTELDNLLRRIERDFEESSTKDVDRACRARRSDIPNLPDGDVSDHFS